MARRSPMASSKKEPKRLTREEVETMPHGELASVKTKKRLLASLPSAEEEAKALAKADERTDADEDLSPRERLRRGIERTEREREEKEAGNGSDES
jgi:hypothetical protein